MKILSSSSLSARHRPHRALPPGHRQGAYEQEESLEDGKRRNEITQYREVIIPPLETQVARLRTLVKKEEDQLNELNSSDEEGESDEEGSVGKN